MVKPLIAACLLLSSSAASWAQGPTLVLASGDDPYFVLAEEIARSESLRVVGGLDEALAESPEFLLWVVSPTRLSDRVLADLGRAIAARDASVSIGLISGSTVDTARALWRRAADVRGQRLYSVNGEHPPAQVLQGRVRSYEPNQTRELTKATFVETLRQADYLTFTGHGGAEYLSLAPGRALTATDIPDLPPVVVGTASCQTFRLWRPNSIALAFADRGAAAYSGFVYSPNEGSLFGEFDGLPFRYTWDEFPIGHVMQVQTRGTLRGFAAFPYHLLLGDPRISLREGPPYRVTDDRKVDDDRILTFADTPAGVVPIRIGDGVLYQFVEIPGVTSAAEDDLFYNSRLQMVDIGDAKYLLFRHDGGSFTMALRRKAPAHRAVLVPLRDSLDAALVLLQPNGGSLFSTGTGVLAWLAIGWRVRRRKGAVERRSGPGALLTALAVGGCCAALHAAYVWLRLDHITISEKPALFDPLSVAGTGVLLAGAAFLYLRARSWRGRAGAVVLAILPALVGALFVAAASFTVNLMSDRQFGADIYNYSLAHVWLIAAAFQSLLAGTVFEVSRGILASGARA